MPRLRRRLDAVALGLILLGGLLAVAIFSSRPITARDNLLGPAGELLARMVVDAVGYASGLLLLGWFGCVVLYVVRRTWVRLTVRGRSARRREIVQRLREATQDKRIDPGALSFFVEKLDDRTQPELDLAALARQHHAAGGLARRLLALQDPASPERTTLLREARRRDEALRSLSSFVPLGPTTCDDDTLARELAEQGFALLEQLAAPQGDSA